MFERFTDTARRVMVYCQDEARRLGHGVIDPHHLALGLLRLEADLGDGPLSYLDIDADALREAIVAEAVADGLTGPTGSSPPFTPQCKKVFERSLKEALMLGDNFIGPGHILIALVKGGVPAALARAVEPDDERRKRKNGLPDLNRAVWESHATWAARQEGVGRNRVTTRSRLKGFVEIMRSADSISRHGTPAGSQHLLLAMAARPDTLAGRILAELGVREEKVQELIERLGTAGTLDAPPEAEYEVRVGEHAIRVDDERSRDMLRRILDDDPDLAERIAGAIERRKQEGAN